jgi:hypothetical protein
MPAGKTYTPIARTILNSNSSTITFSSISSNYTDLIFVINAKHASSTQGTFFRVNSDTGNNYSRTFIFGNGSSVTSARNSNFSYFDAMYFGTEFVTNIININNYSNTTTFKTFLARPSAVEVAANVGLWRSTSAINSISIQPSSGDFAVGSTFTLYGILAA